MSNIFTTYAPLLRRAAVSTLFGIAALCILVAACSDPSASTYMSTSSVSQAAIEAAAAKRVVLAHQSVGTNILDGVQSIAAAAGVPLEVIETRTPLEGRTGIYHFSAGTNGEPLSKLADFRSAIATGAFASVDLAMVKLCYVDFEADLDVAAIARAYIDTVESLQRDFPQVRFAAVTAPLTTVQSGPKAWLKSALGRAPYGYAENRRRQQFNDHLRQAFGPQNLFDLAHFEAAAQRVSFENGTLETLDPALTSDGGHLNERGQQVLGAAFLRFIALERAVQ